jgi:replicative DNA helicase
MANISAEKLLLSGLIKYPDTFFECVQYLTEEDFNSPAAQITFLAAKSLYVDKEADSISKLKLIGEARALGHTNYLSVTKNGDWLDEIFEEKIVEEEVSSSFLEVKRQSLMKAYLEGAEEVREYLSSTDDSLSKIIGKVEDTIVNKVGLFDRGEKSIVSLSGGLREFVTGLAKDPGQIGLDIGHPIWQSRIGNIRNGSITFVVATSKTGKSLFGLRAGVTAAHKNRLPVLLADSELNENDQKLRMVGMLAEVPMNIIECGYWQLSEKELRDEGITDPQDIRKIQKYRERLEDEHFWQIVEELPIDYLSISGMSVTDVIPHMRRWLLTKVKPDRKTHSPQCLIVYDYIKLANADQIKKMAEWQAHGLNVAALHDFATKYNIPVLTFGQTNNQLDDGFGCVAGSKRIVENVTSISYLKRKTDREFSMDGNGSHLMKIFATRYGRGLPSGYINMNGQLEIGKFEELDIGNTDFSYNKMPKDKDGPESD